MLGGLKRNTAIKTLTFAELTPVVSHPSTYHVIQKLGQEVVILFDSVVPNIAFTSIASENGFLLHAFLPCITAALNRVGYDASLVLNSWQSNAKQLREIGKGSLAKGVLKETALNVSSLAIVAGASLAYVITMQIKNSTDTVLINEPVKVTIYSVVGYGLFTLSRLGLRNWLFRLPEPLEKEYNNSTSLVSQFFQSVDQMGKAVMTAEAIFFYAASFGVKLNSHEELLLLFSAHISSSLMKHICFTPKPFVALKKQSAESANKPAEEVSSWEVTKTVGKMALVETFFLGVGYAAGELYVRFAMPDEEENTWQRKLARDSVAISTALVAKFTVTQLIPSAINKIKSCGSFFTTKFGQQSKEEQQSLILADEFNDGKYEP